MSAITVTINLRNETTFVLNKQFEQIVHGSWSPGMSAPQQIHPSQTVTFRSEGNTILNGPPVTGTEGTISYAMSGQPPGSDTVSFHWDSPLVESQYGNTYDEQCPPGFELTRVGGQGHNALVNLTIRAAVPHVLPNFKPSLHALKFKNLWSSHLPALTLGRLVPQLAQALPIPLSALAAGLTLLPEDAGTLTNAAAGLCGGMVFTVLDYWYSGRAIPSIDTAPSSEADPLYRYIRDRLVDSFDIPGRGSRYIAYTLPAYPDGNENVATALGIWRGRAWVT